MTRAQATQEAIQRAKAKQVVIYVYYDPVHPSPDWRSRFCASYGFDVPSAISPLLRALPPHGKIEIGG